MHRSLDFQIETDTDALKIEIYFLTQKVTTFYNLKTGELSVADFPVLLEDKGLLFFIKTKATWGGANQEAYLRYKYSFEKDE